MHSSLGFPAIEQRGILCCYRKTTIFSLHAQCVGLHVPEPPDQGLSHWGPVV